jgi:ribosomal protein S12 methylthiotransferase accessory factor
LEAFERYAGHLPHGKRNVVLDSYDNIAPYALNLAECGLYTSDAYQRNYPHYIPFTPEHKIRWAWGYSFRQQRPILVPEQLAYYWHYRGEPGHVQSTSNGCATGSCLEEAMLYGLLELIERDTFLLAWYARLALPKIDPGSDDQREIRFMLAAVEKEGYELSLLDARLDFKVPSVIAVLRSRDKHKLGQTLVGGGAHLNFEVAIKKAFSEVGTYLAAFIANVERSYEEVRPMADDYSKVVRLPHHTLLHGLPEMREQTDFLLRNPVCKTVEETYRGWREEYPGKQDLLEDLQYCMDMLLERGMDIVVVDQTCPEQARLGLKTVCVIVPGLLPLSFGWDRHRVLSLPRLASVPHMQGFYDRAFSPEQANLVPHPFP